jgi:hypothetical protein
MNSFLIRKLLSEHTDGLTTNQIFEQIHIIRDSAKHEHIRGRISEMAKSGVLERNGNLIKLTEKGKKTRDLEKDEIPNIGIISITEEKNDTN